MRISLFGFLASVIGILTPGLSAAQGKAAGKPNVIIIFADDMGYGDVSSLNPKARVSTPHIDHLAQKGLIFTDAHASASVCTPSRYGLLTGRYAWRSDSKGRVGGGFSKPVIEQNRETIATLFKRGGYSTACIGKWHLGLNWQTKDGTEKALFEVDNGRSNVAYSKRLTTGPNDYGFDYSFIHPASLDMPPYVFLRNHLTVDQDIMLTSDLYPNKLNDTQYYWDKKHTYKEDVYWDKMVWWRRGEISKSFRIENCLTEIAEDGLAFIERHAREKPTEPFFMYLPLTGPHTPWMPSEQFKGKSAIGTYGDFVMNVDHVVGQVAQTLKRLGLGDNTLLVFSSDNGAYWPQSEVDLHKHDSHAGRRGQKGDIWEGGHRMPLVMYWPAGIKKPLVYDHLVSLTDLYATFADLTNQKIQPGNGEDSFSFLHVLQGNTRKATRPSMIHQSPGGLYSIRKDEWKLIDGLGSGGFTAPNKMAPSPDGPKGQLYNLQRDPQESVNLYLQYPNKVKQLQKELQKQTAGLVQVIKKE